jgi:hypothetical protein
LSQALSTSPGTKYDLSFAFNPGLNANPEQIFNTLGQFTGVNQGEFTVTWGGQVLLDLVGGAQAWTNYSFTGLDASGLSTLLMFSERQDNAYGGLDDVVVVAEPATDQGPTNSVPEPSSLALIGMAALAMRFASRRVRSS